jgi:hypothetical protein
MTSDKSYTTEQRLQQLMATATDWQTLGAMSNGWTVSGHAKYRLDYNGFLVLGIRSLSPGTTTDGTTLWSAANGLAAGWQPAFGRPVVAVTDHMGNPGALGSESCALFLNADGSITILGLAGGATRVDCFAVIPLDDS